MTSQSERIQLEMRLSAIEYFLCKLYATLLPATGLSEAQIEEALQGFVQGARDQKFPGLDAAMSDHASAEWEAAMERLVRMQKEMLARLRQG